MYRPWMTARLRSWSRRRGRIALLLVASGCVSTTGGSGGCSNDGALGQGAFSYACPDSAKASAPTPDAQCGSGATSVGALPDVAVGAPFLLRFHGVATGSPRPAVASLAQSSPLGWSLVQPGWLAFIAWSGSDVVDFTHVRGQAIASLRLEPDLTGSLPIGFIADVAATPLGADGAVLGGAVACTFTASDPGVLSILGQSGRVAHIAARAPGDATLGATCMGAQTQVSFHVGAPTDASEDAGADPDADVGEDAEPGEGG